jgi:hypothetical protein
MPIVPWLIYGYGTSSHIRKASVVVLVGTLLTPNATRTPGIATVIPARSTIPLEAIAPAAAVAHQKAESPVTKLIAVELVIAVFTKPLETEPVDCCVAMFVGAVTVPVGRTLVPAQSSESTTPAAEGTAVIVLDAAKNTRALALPLGFITPISGVPPEAPVKAVGAAALADRK